MAMRAIIPERDSPLDLARSSSRCRTQRVRLMFTRSTVLSSTASIHAVTASSTPRMAYSWVSPAEKQPAMSGAARPRRWCRFRAQWRWRNACSCALQRPSAVRMALTRPMPRSFFGWGTITWPGRPEWQNTGCEPLTGSSSQPALLGSLISTALFIACVWHTPPKVATSHGLCSPMRPPKTPKREPPGLPVAHSRQLLACGACPNGLQAEVSRSRPPM